MSNHEPLRDALRSRADQLGDTHPLTLDDVKGRARGIRRRRAAVSGLAAAAVLAVAVPIGIGVTDSVRTDPDDPPVAGPSVSPSASSPLPAGPHRVTLTTEGAALRERALTIPEAVMSRLEITLAEAEHLNGFLTDVIERAKRARP